MFRLSWPKMCWISLALAPSSARRVAGVAQGVHQRPLGDPGTDAGPAVGLADQVLGSSASQALALVVDEEGKGGAELPLGAAGLAGRQVMVDDELERALDRYEADLGALAGNLQATLALPAIDGAQVQAQQLRQAQAREQRRGDKSEVTLGPWVPGVPFAGESEDLG